MAESFGTDPERYDRTRPRCPDVLIQRIIAFSPGREFLDVGCGTGIAARQFQATGCAVLGVEPDARMADFARRGGIEVEVAAFEDWAPAGRTFDAVVAAQAWHWVDPALGAAKAHKVLRPGGLFAAFWHVAEPPPEVAQALYGLVPAQLRAAPGQGYQPLFTKAANGIRDTDGFTAPEQWRFEWQRRRTRHEWLDELPTSGAFTRLPEDELARVLDEVGAAIPDSFTVRYTTVAVTAGRR